MKKRKLGNSGLEVSALGYGAMGLTAGVRSSADKAAGIAILHAAVERGVTLFDTAEAYGPFTNEGIVGEGLAPFRNEIIIATKFGFDLSGDPRRRGVDSRPDHIREVTEAALKRFEGGRDRRPLSAPCRPFRRYRRRGGDSQGPHQ